MNIEAFAEKFLAETPEYNRDKYNGNPRKMTYELYGKRDKDV